MRALNSLLMLFSLAASFTVGVAFVPTSKILGHNFRIYSQEKKEINEEKPKAEWTLQELKQKERKTSQATADRLMLPHRIGEAFNMAGRAVVFAFLIADFILNLNGYAFLVRDGKLTIDTLETWQFEREIRRVERSQQ